MTMGYVLLSVSLGTFAYCELAVPPFCVPIKAKILTK